MRSQQNKLDMVTTLAQGPKPHWPISPGPASSPETYAGQGMQLGLRVLSH